VFVTGDLMNPDTRYFLESTGCSWLGKPFDIAAVKRIAAAPREDRSPLLDRRGGCAEGADGVVVQDPF
jgi:hypothetical protein